MEQIPHKFLISYCSEGGEPQTISTESCSTTLTGLQPETQYTVTVTVCADPYSGTEEKIASISATFHTSELRIVLLGKAGDGKSSTGNTILGEDVFKVLSSPNSVTNKCEACSRTVNGRKIIVVDTPGFLDATVEDEEEQEIKTEIRKCLSLSSPGPHAFIIVLKTGRLSQGNIEVIQKTLESFKSNVLEHSLIVFTFGEQLKVNDLTIRQFVEARPSQSRLSQKKKEPRKSPLNDIVDKCDGRYYVVDNHCWQEEQEGEYSNRRQIEKLFNTILEMVQSNERGYYTEDQAAGAMGSPV
ncbi:GTPase IMAP family member 4-like [Engraulis encrasicolus]|uniref:GTPase IMAP family member 4-like n=1 Tax=Engraulis encrasicolus TaxID=184585 RepID=UPI002FD3A338